MADMGTVGIGGAVCAAVVWVMSWFTPEKVDQRMRADLKKLEAERDALQRKESTPSNRKRYVAVCDRIVDLTNKLQR